MRYAVDRAYYLAYLTHIFLFLCHQYPIQSACRIPFALWDAHHGPPCSNHY
ncbi:Uncharacterised protein [Vibrio cholerae]|nr:Uncharacterised protein [Vibrio cholerae]CSI50531.1 Uncharacterised protein [Vibrio cholerae]